jgi:RNA 3'-phosphate cyclase
MLRIDGSYQEGGGQILRTALALSTILEKEVEICNIRRRRVNPGLATQHLWCLQAFKEIFGAHCEGDYLGSKNIRFYPSRKVKKESVALVTPTAASIGLILQAILIPLVILNEKLQIEIEGGTRGKWAPPVDFYPYVVFPILGIEAELRIMKRGYYPKGGGRVHLRFNRVNVAPINLIERGRLLKIKIMSFASSSLMERMVAQRQADEAFRILETKFPQLEIEKEIGYQPTHSVGSEINICAYFEKAILWSDDLGERGKRAEDVGRHASLRLIEEVEGGACCDRHLADNLIPYMAFLKGRFKTSVVTSHTLTNIWVCQNFLGDIFRVEGNIVSTVG